MCGTRLQTASLRQLRHLQRHSAFNSAESSWTVATRAGAVSSGLTTCELEPTCTLCSNLSLACLYAMELIKPPTICVNPWWCDYSIVMMQRLSLSKNILSQLSIQGPSEFPLLSNPIPIKDSCRACNRCLLCNPACSLTNAFGCRQCPKVCCHRAVSICDACVEQLHHDFLH